jgi:quercetin dioxygenase-like cupin family protein
VDEGLNAAPKSKFKIDEMKTVKFLALMAGCAAVVVAQTRDDLASKLARRVVQRAPLSVPGREIVQVETEIPLGVESGWHVHPGEEVGYIVEGQVEMKVQGRAIIVLKSGDGFLIPPMTPHNARDLGPGTGRMLSTYIVEPGQPLSTSVAQPVR